MENPDTLEASNTVGSKNQFGVLQPPFYRKESFKKKSSLSQKTKKLSCGPPKPHQTAK